LGASLHVAREDYREEVRSAASSIRSAPSQCGGDAAQGCYSRGALERA
jgi:hypothetical protein